MNSPSTLSNRDNAIAFAKCFKLVVITTVALAVPAFGQDRMILGPRQFEHDNGGAVLCAWSIYLAVQARTAACGLARRPVDDAIDQAIVEIDQFILSNSSLHPTRAMLDDFKRRATESELTLARQRGLQNYCESRDLVRVNVSSFGRLIRFIDSALAGTSLRGKLAFDLQRRGVEQPAE
jgi:hypothetical protein